MSDDCSRRWDPHVKPPALVCPRDYCFFWVHQDDPAGHCGYPVRRAQAPGGDWTPVVCKRLDPLHGIGDYYEPHEPHPEEAGLPWFYFISTSDTLIDGLKDAYVRESEALWGSGRQDKP